MDIFIYKFLLLVKITQWAKSPKKQSVGVYNMALYFECRIKKKCTPSECFFGDFSHWVFFWAM